MGDTPQPAPLPPDLTYPHAENEGLNRGILGQIAVKPPRTGRGAAFFAKTFHPKHPYRAVERKRDHIADPYRLAGGRHTLAVQPNEPRSGKGSSIATRTNHARMP